MKHLVGIFVFCSIYLVACGQNKETKSIKTESQTDMIFKMNKSDEEWKKTLNEEQYRVLRMKGTERAFTGKFYQHKEDGTYTCAGCDTALFKSTTKYESGCGWPSYYDVIEGAIVTKEDRSHGMIRTEVLCANCGGHLGHVFEDGPNPTGLRYCINSVSLDFKKEKE